MISNQILQNTIEGLKSIARVDMCIVDVDGKTPEEIAKEIVALTSCNF